MSVTRSLRILVVSDFLLMRQILRRHLERMGFYCVEECASGDHALSRLRGEHIRLVIIEWRIQSMTGAEFLQRIRADSRSVGVPVIVISPENVPTTYPIAKPYYAETLRIAIDQTFQQGVP